MNVVKQCKSCPWRVGCDPDSDIPNGYSRALHEGLKGTIADPGSLRLGALRIMACHHSKPGEEFPCAGWLHHQLGPGNNLMLRMMAMQGAIQVPEVDGEQHERFEDTLPLDQDG